MTDETSFENPCDNFLEINNLSIKFDDFEALHNISYSLPRGKLVGLIGPNG